MLTSASITAIRALMVMAIDGDDRPRSPRQLAVQLGASPTYLGKILGMLVKGGVLSSIRGSRGGVVLRRKPELITLLDVYTATQGAPKPDYCDADVDLRAACGFHMAMAQLHSQLTSSLTRWTVADLIAHPTGRSRACRMVSARRAPPTSN